MNDISLRPTRKFLAGILAASLLFSLAAFAEASKQERDEIAAAIHAKGVHWVAEENSVSRLSQEEKKNRVGTFVSAALKGDNEHGQPSSGSGTATSTPSVGTTGTLPATFDWRNYNGYDYVTPVKDQGNCGSCWAFSTTAALESNVLITKGAFSNLSEQILVSCSGAGSCSGGYIDKASNYFINTGIPDENFYPYTATNGSCANAITGWQNYTDQISNWYWVSVSSPTVDTLKTWLNNYGPLVTTMNVYTDFYYYSGGIYSYTTGSYVGGHGVLLVGYDDTNQYFIVKNSWGTGWGESGYFRIAYSEISDLVDFGQYTIAYYTSTAAPGITLASPNGGEQWQAGTTAAIKWNYTGNPGSYVKLDLYKGSAFYSTIASSVQIGSNGSGSYSWTIPSSQAVGSDYQVMVTSTTNTSYYGESGNYFSIVAPAPAGITVGTPNGGESWKIGSNQAISWTYTGNPGAYVKIELLKSGAVASTIASKANIGSAGQGIYRWKIPSSVSVGSDYTVRITSVTNAAVSDTSNNAFSIKTR